jgi:hypothetical protein
VDYTFGFQKEGRDGRTWNYRHAADRVDRRIFDGKDHEGFGAIVLTWLYRLVTGGR